MDTPDKKAITNLDPAKPTPVTESGELERPTLRRRRIDCGGKPEVADRCATRNGGRAVADAPRTSVHRDR